MLTWLLEDSQGRSVKFKYVCVDLGESVDHVLVRLEQGLILFQQGNVLGQLLVRVQEDVERFGPCTGYLQYNYQKGWSQAPARYVFSQRGN